jgi:hypothetical protein
MTKKQNPAFKMGGLYSRDEHGIDTLIERTSEPAPTARSLAKKDAPRPPQKPVKEKA